MRRNFILDKSGKIKLGVGLILISLILITVLVGALNVEENYYLGDDLRMDLRGKGNYTARFFTPSKTLLKEGSNDLFLYELNELGKYEIKFKFGDNTEIYSFEVVEDEERKEIVGVVETETVERLIEEGKEIEKIVDEKEKDFFEERIEVGKPVRQRKKIEVASNSNKVVVEIPYYASNISVVEKTKNFEISSNTYNKILSVFSEQNAKKEIVVENVSSSFDIEYYTPAPEKLEREISNSKKEVIVDAPDYLDYKNVYVSTNISKPVRYKEDLKVFWNEENRELDFNVLDNDGDGFIDEVEWIVPHLSTQTFEVIIEIISAEHLDSQRNFIEDIYLEVYELDDVWKLVPSGDYVRVSFEENLTKERDITVYAKSDFPNAKIEVYEEGLTNKIAEIRGISEPGYYKTFLTNLVGIEDTFDLRMVGDILIDLIIDPTVVGYCTSITSCLDQGAPATCTCSEVDSSDNVYAGSVLSTKSANLAEVVINMSNSSLIPPGSLISDSDIYVEMSVDTGLSSCTIDYRIGNGDWNSLDSDCTDETTETTLDFNLGSLSESQLESISLKVSAVKNSNRGAPLALRVDYVFLNITYAETGGDIAVYLGGPSDNHATNNATIQFEYTPVSNSGDFINCSYWDNSTGTFSQNKTNSSFIVNDSTNYFSQVFPSDGSFVWNVQCCDATNGCDFGPLNRTLSIDSIVPTVSSVYPANDSYSTSRYGVDFIYNVTDNSDIKECSLFVDESFALKDPSITKGINQTISYPVSQGFHTWAISCLDSAGNIGYSENRTINVSFTPMIFTRRWYETSTENYVSRASTYLSNTRDSIENNIAYSMPATSFYELSQSFSPFMGANGALIGSGTVSFSGYFTATRNNQIYITWKAYVTNTEGDFLICASGDDSTSGTRLTSASGTFTGSCNNPSEIYLEDTDRVKLVINAWNDAGSTVDVGHYWDDLHLSYMEFNTFSSLGDLSVDLTYPENDLSVTTNDEFNMTCAVNCSIGDCLDTKVYAQYNTSSLGWTNIGSGGNLILVTGETNPHDLGLINVSGAYVNFTIDANLASTNNLRCVAESTYSNSTGTTTKEVSVSGVNQPPYISLVSPNNDSWLDSSGFNFTYYVDDVDDDLASCDLYVDGVYNKTNSSIITEGANNDFSISGLSEGIHNWSVNCSDSTPQSNSSETWVFYVDTTHPQINLISPLDDEPLGTNDVEFNFTVSDNLDNPLICNLTIDGIVEDESFEALNDTDTNRTIYDLSVGDHLWNVSCIDEAGNLNISETRNFTIEDSNPIVNLVSPFNDTWVNTSSPVLIYNVSENNDLSSCDLYVDGVFNQTNSTPLINNGENNFTVLGLSQGTHDWFVSCTDDAGLFGISETWDFYVDSVFPQISLNLPVDYFNSTEGDTNFNFTVIDNLDDSLTCNLTIDSVVVDPDFSVINASLTNRFIEDVVDGLHYWNVSCMDEAGNVNTSETRKLNVTEYPSLILETDDNSAFNQTPITLEYLPDDNSDFQSCELYLDGVFNQTNSTPISKGVTNSFSLSPSTGFHNWAVKCTDSFGLINQSENRNFLVDFVSPNVESFYPEDGALVYSSVVDFNFTVIDDYETNLSCDLVVDGVVENSSYFTNGSVSVISNLFSSGGVKFWNISCKDSAGNVNYTQTKNFTLYTPPIIELVSPENFSWKNDEIITFLYNISDGNDDLKNSTLVLDGEYNQTNSSNLINWGQNNFTISGLAEGAHNWTVKVYDSENLLGTYAPYTFYVDREEPNVTINSPSQGEVMDWNNLTLNFSIEDNLDTDFLCNVSVDDFNEYKNEVFYSGENIRYLLRGDGNYSWFVECSDSAGNNFKTNGVNFTVDAPPKIDLNFPQNDYFMTESSITFNYTPQDAIGISSCTLFVDGIQNETDTTVDSNIPNYFTYSGLEEGVHNWTVECTDADSNSYSPPPYDFVRDISSPEVILDVPLNESGIDFNSGQVSFRWKAVDALDNFPKCDLIVDGNVEANDKLMTNNSFTTEIVSGLSFGEHYWNVSCWDSVNNLNYSETRMFNLSYPDFFINASKIVLNDSDIQESENVLINATIENIGYADSENVLVQFFEGNPFDGGTQFGENHSVNINWNSSVELTESFFPDIGLNEIYVVVDLYDDFVEFDEWNNLGNKNISVGAWQFFYGNINKESKFALAGSGEIVTWNISSFEGGSIFVADSESIISWNDLTALGKDLVGGDTTDDFSNVDSLLSMVGFEDSISNLYLGEETNFSVFGKIINEVPITNSTNNSNFVTGILWDGKDDSGNQEFDVEDSEDLIFVTKLNEDIQGAYGVYDYELRVPAKLREYAGEESEVVFYVELF